jgi:hypothetical protein
MFSGLFRKSEWADRQLLLHLIWTSVLLSLATSAAESGEKLVRSEKEEKARA